MTRAIAPTLPDEACDRQTQFGGAVEDDGPSDHSLENFVRGFELTAWWLNEVDELPPGALGACYDRADRRFPAPPPLELSKGEPEA